MSRRAIVSLAALAAIIVAILLVIFMRQEAEAPGSPPSTTAQTEAIKQAEAFRPTDACTTALTPATHTVSGARYTFPSGCLAPGWVAD